MSEQPLNQTEATIVRPTPPVGKELEAIATEERRSVSAVINGVLVNWLLAREDPRGAR